jgi:hypothetical protein
MDPLSPHAADEVLFWQLAMAGFAALIVICCVLLAYVMAYDPKGADDDAPLDASPDRAPLPPARLDAAYRAGSDVPSVSPLPRDVPRLASPKPFIVRPRPRRIR